MKLNSYLLVIFSLATFLLTSVSCEENGEDKKFREFEVEFEGGNGDLTLEGTLLLPLNPTKSLLPGIVLIHGSGPQSRDVNISGQLGMAFGKSIPLFKEISESLVLQGFAVLRYDKRTCSIWNGCENSYPIIGDPSYWDFIADTTAAVDYLITHKEVSNNQITVIGHSQGGQIIPYISRDHPSVQNTILLASPYQPADMLWAWQADLLRSKLEELDYTAEQIDQNLAEIDQTSTELTQLRNGIFTGSTIADVPVAFWKEYMQAGDETPSIIQSLDTRVLVVQGGYDWNVPPEQAKLFKQDLAEHKSATVVILDELTHPFVRITEPDWSQITEDDIGDGVDQMLIDTLVDWL
ncbi:MAG: alpha/beta hydrolase [Proteobacteria bacterium]|nr:alpha/beta hydrolase [Pseudomonadota bacterium]